MTASRQALDDRLILTGELVAADAHRLIAPNVNIWPLQIRRLVDDGAAVESGEVLVEFDNAQLADQIDQLEQSLIEAENQLASTAAQARSEELDADFRMAEKRAELDKAAVDARVPEGLLSSKEYEERQLALERSELLFEEARAALDLKRESVVAQIAKETIERDRSRVEYETAVVQLESLTLTAPYAGIAVVSEDPREARPLGVGDSVWPGMTVATLPSLRSMLVEARLFDVDDGRVTVGDPAVAVVDAFPEIKLEGRVTEVDAIANEESGRSQRRSFRTRIELEGIDFERMRPGMSVRVVVNREHEDLVVVPRSALSWEDGSARAHLADGSHVAVQLGPCDPDSCVVEAGLDVGARLSPAGEKP